MQARLKREAQEREAQARREREESERAERERAEAERRAEKDEARAKRAAAASMRKAAAVAASAAATQGARRAVGSTAVAMPAEDHRPAPALAPLAQPVRPQLPLHGPGAGAFFVEAPTPDPSAAFSMLDASSSSHAPSTSAAPFTPAMPHGSLQMSHLCTRHDDASSGVSLTQRQPPGILGPSLDMMHAWPASDACACDDDDVFEWRGSVSHGARRSQDLKGAVTGVPLVTNDSMYSAEQQTDVMSAFSAGPHHLWAGSGQRDARGVHPGGTHMGSSIWTTDRATADAGGASSWGYGHTATGGVAPSLSQDALGSVADPGSSLFAFGAPGAEVFARQHSSGWSDPSEPLSFFAGCTAALYPSPDVRTSSSGHPLDAPTGSALAGVGSGAGGPRGMAGWGASAVPAVHADAPMFEPRSATIGPGIGVLPQPGVGGPMLSDVLESMRTRQALNVHAAEFQVRRPRVSDKDLRLPNDLME
jgi:hypothetical protein